jgi:hypothetical protein
MSLRNQLNTLSLVTLLGLTAVACKKEEQAAPPVESAAPAPTETTTEAPPADMPSTEAPAAESAPADAPPPAGN